MLEVEGLSARIKNVEVLRNVSLSFPRGTVAALVGHNGAGKTSLLKAIMGLLPAGSGRIAIDGMDVTALDGFHRARNGVGYMPEDRRLIPSWTVEENLMLPSWACRGQAEDAIKMVYDVMPELKEHRGRRALQLSGGQQKLVALGRSLTAGRRLLLLDEPFEGVAPALAQRLGEVLATLGRNHGMTVLMSESEFIHTRNLVNRVYAIDRGAVALHQH